MPMPDTDQRITLRLGSPADEERVRALAMLDGAGLPPARCCSPRWTGSWSPRLPSSRGRSPALGTATAKLTSQNGDQRRPSRRRYADPASPRKSWTWLAGGGVGRGCGP
jgi:hypothetical protein